MTKRLTVTACLVVGALATWTTADNEPLEDRVSKLESKVAALEKQVADLTSRLISPDPSSQSTAVRGTWKVLANWRTHLRVGMTKTQVRELMGEPDKVSVFSASSEWWNYGCPVGGCSPSTPWYPSGGKITFEGGKVESWLEPSDL